MRGRGNGRRGRGRFSPGYSGGYRGRGRQNYNQNSPQDFVSMLAAAVQQNQQPQQGTSSAVSLSRANITAQKLTSKCTRCNVLG